MTTNNLTTTTTKMAEEKTLILLIEDEIRKGEEGLKRVKTLRTENKYKFIEYHKGYIHGLKKTIVLIKQLNNK